MSPLIIYPVSCGQCLKDTHMSNTKWTQQVVCECECVYVCVCVTTIIKEKKDCEFEMKWRLKIWGHWRGGEKGKVCKYSA